MKVIKNIGKGLFELGKGLLCIVGVIAGLILLCVIAYKLIGYDRVYEYTRVDDYLTIKGNFDNDMPRWFIKSFFPEEIEDEFSNVVYHYKAKRGDGHAYECYLEFTVDSDEEFQRVLNTYVKPAEAVPFAFDESYMDYTIEDDITLQTPRSANENVYPIDYALMGKILYRAEDRRFIFAALGMWDGGGADTVELGHFFTRFNIDPLEFEKLCRAD